MKDEVKDRIYMLFTFAIVALVIAGGLIKAAPLYREYAMLKAQDAERDQKIRELEHKTAEVNELERRFNTDVECVQSVAREVHRYHPREFVVIFGDSNSHK